jgi:gamma-glutamyltranspeptidase
MTAPHGPRTGRPPTRAGRGMVAAPHPLATGAGVAVLRRGGSAVDAAIATNAVLCATYPHMAGLGGDGFWLIAEPDGSITGLNASGPAAMAATRDYYAERGHADAVPVRGALSALTVPGAVDGWRLAHERHGRLPWQDLFDDAVAYARAGVPVGRSLADWLVDDADLLSEHDLTARTFLPHGPAGARRPRRLAGVGGPARCPRRLLRRGPGAAVLRGVVGRRQPAAPR